MLRLKQIHFHWIKIVKYPLMGRTDDPLWSSSCNALLDGWVAKFQINAPSQREITWLQPQDRTHHFCIWFLLGGTGKVSIRGWQLKESATDSNISHTFSPKCRRNFDQSNRHYSTILWTGSSLKRFWNSNCNIYYTYTVDGLVSIFSLINYEIVSMAYKHIHRIPYHTYNNWARPNHSQIHHNKLMEGVTSP